MIRVHELSRRYRDFHAVRDVSFTIQGGQIVGLLGHNGAGKTTIMKMLSGYLEPTSGRIEIDGVDVAENPRAVQRRLGYLPENLPVYRDLTVADYLDYAAQLKGLQGAELRASVRQAITATELEDRLLAPVATLSRGYQQRVGVAQALLGDPQLLILDEPTNGLDPNQTEHMRDLIRRLAKSATVILSTHIMQEVEAVCDHVLILRQGRLALDTRLADLQRSGALSLRTDMPAAQLRSAVERIAQSARLHEEQPQHFRVDLPSDSDADQSGAQLASAIIGAGHQLFQLAPLVRNLESVFREVNLEGGLRNAA
jgi:ABC-2 type transport system ATP-binding protein